MPFEELLATPPLPPLPKIDTRTNYLSHDSNDENIFHFHQPSPSLPERSSSNNQSQIMDDAESNSPDGKKGGKSRRELPAGAVATLKAWLLSPEHFTHPYPTPQDQIMLMQKTGIDKKQLKNWFTNARRRIWKPMLKKQLEQGKIQQTGSGGVVAMNAPVMMMNAQAPGNDYSPGPSVDQNHGIQQNYQNVLQQPQPQYGNTGYVQQQQQQQPPPPAPNQYGSSNYYPQGDQRQYNQNESMVPSNSIGSLPGASSGGNLNKTDSHAVLMELFARDQDLVRRQASKERSPATNGEQNQNGGNMMLGSQHPMSSKIAGGSSTLNKLGNVPSMNSWPRFSSVSSLNNLGTMTGVKSITNMSGADLVSQGSLNRKGNLAQVKSIENMGRADSYAFLEVFFDNPGGSNQSQRGIKRERDEDDNVGLSLDGDDGNSPAVGHGTTMEDTMNSSGSGVPVPAPLPADGQDKEGLKRAYDDALAARGLISVSRSCEKLSDLALPAKMQKTISQEYLKSMTGNSTTFTTFSFNPQPAPAPGPPSPIDPVSIPNQHPALQNSQMGNMLAQNGRNENDSVEVPATTKCAICHQTNVDTQLRPCGHLFHGTCVKGSIQNSLGSPCCPIDGEIMISCILAVPENENA